MKSILKLFVFIIIIYSNVNAQVSVGADFYSRYIWRGLDFGNSLSLQPAVEYSYKGFSAGVWGAYSIGATVPYSESDFYLTYSVTTDAGEFEFVYTDYFFPDAGLEFSNYKNDGSGAHVLEGGISYTGTSALPVSISFYYNFHNDTDKSKYFEISYPFKLDDADVSLFIGGSLGKSVTYSTTKSAITNTGISVSKEIKITDSFSVPITGAYVINPNLKTNYFIVGFSF